jgi:hypothetical protein
MAKEETVLENRNGVDRQRMVDIGNGKIDAPH